MSSPDRSPGPLPRSAEHSSVRGREVVSANRFVALALACAWIAGGAGGIIVAIHAGRQGLTLLSLFALGYGIVWLRVFAQSRLLTWSEIAMPWRRLSVHADRSRAGGKR